MKSLLLSVSLVLLAGGGVVAQERHTNVITPETVKWMENPAFPKGIQIATLVGDPTKSGETVVQRIKFPPNFTMPPHTHPDPRQTTVLRGTLYVGFGETFDERAVSTDVVSVGSTVHVKDQKTEKSVKYKIVGSAEANPSEMKLSNESPVGKALLGHKRNDVVSVPVPRGPQRKLKITKIER